MKKQSGKKETSRRQHSPEFRKEALALAEKIGIAKAAKELGLHNSQLYGWRSKARANQDQSDLEQSLAAENARLKRMLAEQAEELAIVKKAATNSKHNLPVAPNLLEQDFTATAPNQKYVGDIIYLWTDEGWLYLATIIDLYSRLVLGWSMSERMTAQLVCDALKMALWRRHMPINVIVHSDRGSQYCSGAYQKLLDEHGLICSMSGKGNCYDNGCAESFFHSLKVEAIHGERFVTREEMRQTVFGYIEVDYNRTRRHSANGYISPEAFEVKNVA